MKQGGFRGNRVRIATAVSVGALVLATAGPVAAADPAAASRKCRTTVVSEMAKLGKLINGLIDKCHKNQMKAGAPRTSCNVIDSAEMGSGKYDSYKQKAHDKIALKCFPGDPALGNYQAEDAYTRLLGIVERETAALAVSTLGDDVILATDKVTQKCINTVGAWNAKLFSEVLKDSNKAQKLTDGTATVFGRMLESNLDAGDKTTPLAVAAIPAVCAGVSGIDSCTNETTCLTATRTAAQKLTHELYHGKNVCEPLVGTRTVEVTIATPENLAGMKVDLDYPQFETGLVGTEQSQLVSDAVALTHTDPGMFKVVNDRETDLSVVVGSTNAFIQSGDKVTFTFDACIAKEVNMCNRTQQVVGCSIPVPPFNDNPAVCTFPNATSGYPDGLITGVSAGCCPGDNACLPQSLATTCSVADPVRANGTAVSGVTCSVTISGT